MKFKKNTDSIRYRWLMSYGAVLLIPVFVFTILYSLMNSLAVQQLEKYNELTMNYIIGSMNDNLNEYYRVINFVTNSQIVNESIAMDKLQNPEDYYKLKMLRDEMRKYIDGLEIKNFFYIYLKNIDMVVSGSEVAESEEFYRIYYKEKGVSYTEWLNKIKFGPASYTRLEDNSGSVLNVSLLPINSRYNKRAGLVMDVELRNLQEDITGDNKSESEFAVFDNKNRLVVSSEDISNENLTLLKHAGKSGEYKINGERFFVKVMQNMQQGYKYTCMISNSDVMGKLGVMKICMIFAVLLMMVLEIVLIRKSIMKNYSPIESILKSLRINSDDEKNEYAAIESAMKKLITDKEKTEDILDKQKDNLKNIFLSRYMKYPITDDGKEQRCTYDIQFAGENFIVMLFYLEDYEGLFADESSISDEEKYKEVSFALKNVSEEAAVNYEFAGYLVEIDSALALLLSVSEKNSSTAQQKAYELACFLSEFFRDNLKIYFKISISELQKGMSGISLAYEQAMEAMEHKSLFKEERIIVASGTGTADANEYYAYDLEKEQKLINCIKSGNEENTIKIIDEIFKILFEQSLPSSDMIRIQSCDMIGTLMKIRNYKNDKQAEISWEWKNIDDLKEKITSEALRLCRSYSSNKNMRLKKFVDLYIAENYSNPNLGVGQIADEFDVHRSHLSKVYKSQTGIGVHEAINRYRLERAKELLKNTNMTVEHVSSAVGFTDIRTLIRIFKNYEGVTPSQFRTNG